MDFQRLMADEKIKVSIPIFSQDSIQFAIIVQELLNELEIETLPRYLIDSLNLDVSSVQVGESLSVADLPIFTDENYTVITPHDSLIYNVIEPTAFEEEEAEEADGVETVEATGEESEGEE